MIISGGDPDYQQLVKYNILNDRFIDYGDDYLKTTLGNGDGEYGTSVYFTQINENTLYTINQNGKSIHVYNLESLSYHVLDTTIPITVNHQGSIASSEAPIPRLYITGGYLSDILDDLQILELEVLQWVATPPSMNNARWHHGSIYGHSINPREGNDRCCLFHWMVLYRMMMMFGESAGNRIWDK